MDIAKEIDQKKFESEHHRLLVNLIFTGNWLNYHNARYFKQWGLTPQQYNILRILRGAAGPVTVHYLTRRMLDKSSNASRLVDKLEAKALVTRHACPTDKRAVDVTIATPGLELLRAIEQHQTPPPGFIGTLSEREAQQLNALLDKARGR